jgi:pimeloyl-ACP methyl ester carboxylesterase
VPSSPVDPLPRPVPRLDREIDGLALSEWPGEEGPLVCLRDPLGSLAGLAPALGDALAPDWRVLSLVLPADLPYQSHVSEVHRLLDTFGFKQPVLLGSGLAGGIALLVAAWYPTRIAGVVLVSHTLTSARRRKIAVLAAEQPAWRAWLDAPPAWSRLERQVVCPMLHVRARAVPHLVGQVRAFLQVPPEEPAGCPRPKKGPPGLSRRMPNG